MADVVLDDEVVVIEVAPEETTVVEVDDPSVVLEISGQGTPGAPGKSAYEVAVDNGFIGTEQEWLDSLNTDVVAVIETWASIPDNTLGILDPETATDSIAELLGQFGATQEIIDQAVGGLSFFVPYLDPEQPSDVKAAIRNIANWLTFIIVQIFSINGQLSPINSQLSDLASQISGILDNLSGYGDIVTHNVSEFATSAQGIKADTALQPEDLPDPDSNGLHLDIRDFGAAVDGLTDDWQAIMDTITEAVATSRPVYIPAGTTFIRRAVVVPSGVEIFGAGIDKSIVKRRASVGSAMVGVVGFNSTEVEVESAVDFAVGDPIHMWDLAFYEGDDVLRTITSIEDNVIHFSPSTSSDYSAASMGRVSTSTSVFRSENGAEHINIYGLTVDQSMNEFDPKGSLNNGDSQTEFTLAAIHLEGARHCKVERVKFINAFGDAYSDQGRGTYDDPNHNEIGWCVFDSPYRHAIHLGSANYGSRVHHNLVNGVDLGYCMFYCAEVVNCEVSGNYFMNSTVGLVHIDERDKHSIVTNNYFINVGVAINVQGDTTVDDFSVLIANNMFWNDQNVPATPGITIKLPGALFNGNRLHNSFLRIADGGNRSIVTDNVFTQSQDSDDRIAGLDWQVWLEAQDVVFSDNRMDYAWGGVQVMGAHRLVASGNSFSNMVNKELDFAYYDTSDCVIDGPPVKITYTDGGTATRLIYNNLGNNGTDDPAIGGDWNSISDSKYEGTAVTWLGNGAQQISRFIDGQWVNLASAFFEAWNAIPDDSLAVLDPDTIQSSTKDALIAFGVPEEQADSSAAGIMPTVSMFITEQPVDVKAAIRNIAALLTLFTANVVITQYVMDQIESTISTYGDIVTRSATEFATAAQGLLAETAVQGDASDFATAEQGLKADSALQPDDIDTSSFATSSQGDLADSAVQPGDRLWSQNRAFRIAGAGVQNVTIDDGILYSGAGVTTSWTLPDISTVEPGTTFTFFGNPSHEIISAESNITEFDPFSTTEAGDPFIMGFNGRSACVVLTAVPSDSTWFVVSKTTSFLRPEDVGTAAYYAYEDFATASHNHDGVYDPAGTAASKIEDTITDGVTSKAPSQNAVFDALSLKVPTSRTLAGLDLSSNITASQLRTALALVIGTDVQAFHANLTLLSGLTAAADRIPYFTGSNSAALLTLDTDVTLSGNSDTSLSTQKAVKGYVDTRIPIHRGATSFSGMKISTRSALVASQAVAGSAGSGRILYTPIFLPAGTYNTISIVTTVAGTSTWRLGVYNHASGDTTRPGTVAVDAGTVSTSGTPGALTISGLNLVVANDDWYWCAAQVDAYTSNPTIVAMSGQAGQDLLPFYGWPGQMASYLRGYAGFQDFGVSTGSLATARSITNNTSTGVAYAQDVPRFWIGA